MPNDYRNNTINSQRLDSSIGHYLRQMFSCKPWPNKDCKELFDQHVLTYFHENKV